ncbi:MAG: hypothetical protein M3Z31_13420 [Pseudomonadota bacterium]|nr:hypothetical protein [Pseudomonadota bacterium]
MTSGGLLAVLLAGVCASAQAQLISLAWGADNRFQSELQVAPGKFVELCDKLVLGSRVEWSFDAASPMDFNIHYHEGSSVRFPAREDGVMRSQGVLEPTSTQEFCWMWSNKTSDPVTLTVGLRRA